MGLGFGEIMLLSVVALLVFGPKRLPDLGLSLGKAITSFKKGLHGIDDTPIVPPVDKISHQQVLDKDKEKKDESLS